MPQTRSGAHEVSQEDSSAPPNDLQWVAPTTSLGTEATRSITVLHIFSGDLWAGAEVMIFTLLAALKADSAHQIIGLGLNEGALATRLRDAGIEVCTVPEADTSFVRIALKAYQLLKHRKIDIIHSHRYKENILALLLSWMMRIDKLVATVHGLPEPVAAIPSSIARAGLKTRLNHFALRRYFTRVIAVSEEMREALVMKYRFSQSKVDVIYNGISGLDCTYRHRPLPQGEFHIGTVGRTVPVKDFDLFLDIAAELRGRSHRIRFSILGEGPLTQRLMVKANALNLTGAVEFLAPRPDPSTYYQLLDLYLNTSLHEGIPLTVLEAMAMGLPVVAPRVGGIQEIILHGRHGLLVDSRNPRDFADACTRLIEDQGLRTALGEGAFHRVRERFTSEEMVKSYKRVYRELCRAPIS